jgi:hypothetical protein
MFLCRLWVTKETKRLELSGKVGDEVAQLDQPSSVDDH